MPVRIAVVPHTHWDREWYAPFETFRLRLVDTLDELLDLLEADPSYRRFLLDGQMAAVDDYLEVRPDAAPRLRALASAGRLAVGPWYTLMDEFLVSGETIVRDLQLGLRRACDFGGAMAVGYLPDMFGHVAQMPQLLVLAGLEHAVVWRGVPAQVQKTAFVWEAPDGSAVRAEYLAFGYGNGALLPDDAKALVRRVSDHLELARPFLVGEELLLMNGSDHLRAQEGLGRVLAEANALQDELVFEVTSLPEYLAGKGVSELPRWRGELRSGSRANMLMGVTSNRVDVKRATAAAERAIERRAEPYAALFLPPGEWPERLLELAWTELVRNAAHDSICACSVDEVVDAVLQRAASARAIGEGIAERALGVLASSSPAAGPVVVNPSPRPRSGVVELVLGDGLGGAHLARDPAVAPAGDEASPRRPVVQLVAERAELPSMLTLDTAAVRALLSQIDGARIADDAWVHDATVDEDDSGIDVWVTIGVDERSDLPAQRARQDLLMRIGARPDRPVRIHLDQPRIRRVVARVGEVPGFGWRRFEPLAVGSPAEVGADGASLSNGLVTVRVDPADGTFELDGHPGMGRLVEGGDLGDSYNYSPPTHDVVVEAPERVALRVEERGPVRARLVVVSRHRWPERADPVSHRRTGSREVEVETTLELRADEPVLRVTTAFVNPARDHRVRLHFPLPEAAASSEAECAFALVRRGLDAEGRPDERGLPTFPARRFVRAGGLTVVHDGVCEYELVDVVDGPDGRAARALALTVLRATGMLSRLGMTFRPLPAGPLTPVEGLQMVGRPVSFHYAVALGEVDPWALADEVLVPLDVVTAAGGGSGAASGSALAVSGAEVSAVRREAGALEVRVFNPTADRAYVSFAERAGWLVDLRGSPLEPFVGGFDLRPHGIATVRFARD